MRIAILIDDDQDDLDILQDVIESINDIACFKFTHPVDALNFLSTQEQPVDFIFTDYNMPKLNGEEVVAEIRKKENCSNTIIAILSTSIDVTIMERVLSNGADYAFIKEPNFQDYTGNIKRVLQPRKIKSVL